MESREGSLSPRLNNLDNTVRVNSRMSSERNLNDQVMNSPNYNNFANSSQTRTRSPERNRRSSSPRRRSRSPLDRSGEGRNTSRNRRPVREKECRVFISNLSFATKWQDLKDLMKKKGNVEHVEIFTDSNNRPTGIGIVEFESAEGASEAIRDFDGVELDGRKLKLREDQMSDEKYRDQLRSEKIKANRSKIASSVESKSLGNVGMIGGLGNLGLLGGLGTNLLGVPTIHSQLYQLLTSKNEEINSTVFVSNLDFDMDWRQLKDVFRRAGHCTRSDVALDQDNKSKGYGTVVFETPIEALVAIAIFDRFPVGKRTLAVRLDRLATLNSVLKQIGVDVERLNISQVMQLHTLATVGANSAASAVPTLGGLGGSLASLTNTTENINTNQSTNLNPLSGLVGLQQTGVFQGANNSLAQTLIGAITSTDVGRRSERRRGRDSESNHMVKSGSSRRDSFANECKVFVRNLPFSVTWQDLKDLFNAAGPVTNATISMDDKMRSKGYGTVLFESKDDASKAIELFNRSTMQGRQIEVRLDWDRR